MLGKLSELSLCVFLSSALLWSAPLSAHHKPDHHKGGGKHDSDYGKKKSKNYKHKNKKKQAHKRKGPPPWAPAHGYRAKHRYLSSQDNRVHEFVPADLVKVPEVGLGQCDKATLGAVLGAAVGGAAGSRFGKGDGKILTSVGGAIIGALVGGNIGRAMDQVDQNCVGQILERAPTGSAVTWRDPDRSVDYNVTPTRTYRRNDGRYCRDYQTKIVIAGRVENAHGTACRGHDGRWERNG